MLAFTGCTDYEDDINKLDDRLTAVEGTLADLQKKITDGAVITDVEKTSNGVTVTLSDDSKFELTNGTNGTNGSIVTIGPDGYWYIDDVKTDYPATGPKGDDGATGNDGKPGADANVVYYVPNEDGFWYKVTETQDGEPIGEPVKTQISWVASADGVTAVWDEENGALLLSGVEGVDGPFAIPLYSALKSLAFVPEVMHDGTGVIDFYTIFDMDDEFATSNQPKVTYRVNPANADLTGVEWAFINRDVITKVAGDNTDLVSIISSEKGEKGGMVFELKANDNESIPSDFSGEDQVLLALRATLDNEEIVSDYAFVQQSELKEFTIINKARYDKEENEEIVEFFANTEASDIHTDVPLADDPNFTFVYNESLNVYDSLETYAKEIFRTLPEVNVEPTYSIELVDEYIGDDNITDQQKFVSLDENGVLTVNSEWLTNGGRAAIGRTPVLYVQSIVENAKGEDAVIADCYIKVKIVDESYSEEELGTETFVTLDGEFEYMDLPAQWGKDAQIVLDWDVANSDIFEELGMSYDQFRLNFDLENVKTEYKTPEDKDYTSTRTAGVNASDSFDEASTATNLVLVQFNNLMDENTTGSVRLTIPAKDNHEYPNVAIVFNYTITHEHVWPDFSDDYLIGEDIVQVKGKLVGDKWTMVSSMDEHFVDYLNDYVTPANHGFLTFTLPGIKADGTPMKVGESAAFTPQDGAEITGSDWRDQEISLTEPLEGETKDYIVTMYTSLANGNYCQKNYTVRFVSPFVVSASNIELKTLPSSADSKDLSQSVVVKDTYGKVVYEKGKVTSYGSTEYKLKDADFANPVYKLVFDSATDTEASFGGNLTLSDTTVAWDNDGTDLQANKTAKYSVEFTVSNICTISATGNITVLSTANSRN